MKKVIIGTVAGSVAAIPLLLMFLNNESPIDCHEDVRMTQEKWPKILHQIWLRNPDNPVPMTKESQEAAAICRKLNPGYDYKFWTNQEARELLETHFAWFIPTYNSYKFHIQRADAIRYFILYHYGGIYLDIDASCNISFQDIIKEQAEHKTSVLLGQEEPLGVNNYFMMATANHPFMYYLISRLKSNAHGLGLFPYYDVLRTAGTFYVFLSYQSYPCKYQIKLIKYEKHSEEYFTHWEAHTWHQWDGKYMLYIGKWTRRVGGNTIFLVLLGIFLVSSFIIVYVKKLYQPWQPFVSYKGDKSDTAAPHSKKQLPT